MGRARLRMAVGILLPWIAACADPASPGTTMETLPEPGGTAPRAPTVNDGEFAVSGLGNWYLIGDEIAGGDGGELNRAELELEVLANEDTRAIDVWLDDAFVERLERGMEGGAFATTLDIAELPPGEHSLLLSADGSDDAFHQHVFQRSHPLYVLVSNDWDDADQLPIEQLLQEELHARHPQLRMTHFVGPYTFTDPGVTAERAAELAAWVSDLQDTHRDEIGLHIHPYCSFVEAAGVPCRSEPSSVYAAGDPSGYTVILASYTEEEVGLMLDHADELFLASGLGKPTSFRAGGWTADLSTLRALASHGYVADTSANNWRRMEEWMGEWNGVLYEWNAEHWATIDDTSQPYYPSTTDILVPGPPALSILEVPDNGILADYVTVPEMIEVLAANWPGGALSAPVTYSIGYHPGSLPGPNFVRIDGALDHVDDYLAIDDAGPIVYATLSEMPAIWQAP